MLLELLGTLSCVLEKVHIELRIAALLLPFAAQRGKRRPTGAGLLVAGADTRVRNQQTNENEYRTESTHQGEQAPTHVAVDDGLPRILRVDPHLYRLVRALMLSQLGKQILVIRADVVVGRRDVDAVAVVADPVKLIAVTGFCLVLASG